MTRRYSKISRIVGKLASVRLPGILRPPILWLYAKALGINHKEAEHPLSFYESCNAFFTRNLRGDLRPIDTKKRHLVSPVDARILEYGSIEDGQLIQAKGLSYAVTQLIGMSHAKAFEGGHFMTLYLAPFDCHRIFSPIDSFIHTVTHTPGHLLPVREPYISKHPHLYTQNERLSTLLQTDFGKVAVVKVAATNVGDIQTTFDPFWQTNLDGASARETYYEQAIPMKKGQWLATFHMGSTVILLIEKKGFNWTIENKHLVKYGETLGTF